jgi:hypothetical protein
MKTPDLFESEDEWKLFLRGISDAKQVEVMSKAKFIHDFLRMVRFNKQIEQEPDRDMKYDRLRQNYDIRNKPEEELATYQKSQVRMISEDNYNG